MAAFLDKADDTTEGRKLVKKLGLPAGTPRIDALLQRDVISGLGSSAASENARKLLIEQYGGKAKMQMDLSSNDRSMSPVGSSPTSEQAIREAEQIAKRCLERELKGEAPPSEGTDDQVPPGSG